VQKKVLKAKKLRTCLIVGLRFGFDPKKIVINVGLGEDEKFLLFRQSRLNNVQLVNGLYCQKMISTITALLLLITAVYGFTSSPSTFIHRVRSMIALF